MQHDVEEQIVFRHAEDMLGNGKMAAARYRQKFGQPLYDALNNRIKNIHYVYLQIDFLFSM